MVPLPATSQHSLARAREGTQSSEQECDTPAETGWDSDVRSEGGLGVETPLHLRGC